jgi:Abnormal spindle-like microcephaly-assoc'd, ASPM-SPD-2-Hydin
LIPRVILMAGLLVALLPLSALGQLQVFDFNGTTDTPVVGTLDIGTASAGTTIATRFHVRNVGEGPAVLQTISLAGGGFTITSSPSLPYILAPYTAGSAEPEIDVAFSPTIIAPYSATFVINTINMILEGTAVPSVMVTVGSSTTPLSAGEIVDFGSVDVGSAQTQDFVLSNLSTASITVATLTVSGADFAGPIGLTTPVQLTPGQTASFQITFTPQSGTIAQGVLTVGQQTFNLTGQGVGSPLEQLQLFVFNGTSDSPAGALVNIGVVAPGDAITTRFHVRNVGQGPATLGNPSLSGGDGGFAITSGLSPGYILAPYTAGSAEPEIDVAFSSTVVDSYSATLAINGVSVILTGTAVASAALTVGSGTTPLSSGATVNFGSVDEGSTKTETFVLTNSGSASINLATLAITGAGFKGPIGLSAPLQLAPGQMASFQVSFTPTSGTLAQGVLTVDTRTFNLTGQGLAAMLPSTAIVFASTLAASAQQNSISIPLASPSQSSATGTLTLAFQSSVTGVSDDPAIQFLSGPLRKASVSISPGDTSAKIGGQPSMAFQTGTTAGTITFTLALTNEATQQATLTIPPSPVNLDDDTISAVRLFGSLNVSFGGFDNTYSASQLAFTFYDTKGLALPQGAIDVDAASAFHTYFSTTQAGGTFQVLAEFPVTGNTALIGFVTAQITNSLGTSTAVQIPFGN